MIEVIGIIFWVVMNILNRLTPHYSGFAGVLKWILAFIEHLSITRSRDIPGVLKILPKEESEKD